MFKGVLFDLDGVLTDTAEYHYKAWKHLGESLGINIDRQFNETLKGVSREESLEKLLVYGGREQDFSRKEREVLAATKNKYYVDMIQEIDASDVFPGIVELLKELKKAGIKVALASASKNGSFLLDCLGLTNYFDSIADPESVAKGKPAPDIFELAAKNVGLSPRDCVGIEDAQSGIQAILASGAFPVGVGNKKVLGLEHHVVSGTETLTFDYLKKAWLAHNGESHDNY